MDSLSLEDFWFFQLGKVLGRIGTQASKKTQTETSFREHTPLLVKGASV